MAQYESNYNGSLIDTAILKVYNLKTINGTSIYGPGNIEIQSGGGGEVVTINLTTNQSSHSDIIGATVKIKDNTEGGYLLETTWQGTEITFEVPVPVNYTVEFGGVTNYKTPSNVTYNSRTGRSRSISVQYKTEIVTVTVNTNVTGVTAAGQIITINGVNTTIPASGQVIQKVAFGTSYTISVNNKSLYTTPSSLSYTANLASRNVTMTYTKITNGVFAVTTTGGLIPEKDINTSSPSSYVGVAVLSGNISFFFNKNIPIGSAAAANIANFKALSYGWYIGYSGYVYDIDGVTQILYNNDLSVTRNTAFNVYNNGETGISNTNIIANHTRAQNDTAIRCATRYYNTVQNPLTNTYNGYIPSLAELFVMSDNIASILSIMSKIGGTDISNYLIWGSVFGSPTSGDNKAVTAWFLDGGGGTIGATKSNSAYTSNLCLVCFPLT